MTLYEDIGKAMKQLLFDDPYYALFLLGIQKQETTAVPTLAVGLTGLNVTLLINKDFWSKLPLNQKLGVLKHEVLHLCFYHLTSSEYYSNHLLDNIATDLEINQYIKESNLPPGGVTMDYIKETFGVTLPEKKGRDFYYKELLKHLPPQMPNLGDAEHFWEKVKDLSDADKAIVQNQIVSMMEAAATELEKSRPGSVPGEITQQLSLIKREALFDWAKYIRQWVTNSIEVTMRQTRFKPNPYFKQNPSSKLKLKHNILCAIDTSASVCDTTLHKFLSEIYNLWRFGHTINIMSVDTQLYDPYVYKGSVDIKLSGRGGTSFTPTLEYFNSRNEYSAMIYFTDGEAELPPNANKPMLWVIDGTSKYVEGHNGKILKIKK